MSQSTELHVPDGYYPPHAVVTDTDHGAWIIIAVTLGFTFVIISSLIRIFLRISFVQRPGLDDTFLFVATVGDIPPLNTRSQPLTQTAGTRFYTNMHHLGGMFAWPGPVDRASLTRCN